MDDETAIWLVFYSFGMISIGSLTGEKTQQDGKESNVDAKKTTFSRPCVGGVRGTVVYRESRRRIRKGD
jgi:hypothetical protein